MIAASDLLSVWESGVALGPADRALLLHAAARPDLADLHAVPLGERDAELFALRRALFGTTIPVRLACPECAEELEFDFDTRAVRRTSAAAEPVPVTVGRWTATVRVPTSGDLVAAARAADPREVLVARCVLAVDRDGQPVPAGELPADVVDRLAEVAAAADPCADVRVAVTCPECGAGTHAELDIVSCLWAELDAWARATLLDVSLLAGSFGWAERDILALSPMRRRYYLELAGHG